jgi:hypothetical protein
MNQGIQPVNLTSSAGSVPAVTGALTGSGVSVTASVSQSGNATITLTGGTYTNLPIIFEGSADGGTTYFTIDATQTDGTNVNTAWIVPSAATRAWNIMCPGYTHVRVRQTAAATAQTVNPTVTIVQGPFLYDPSPSIAPIDGQKATFSSGFESVAVTIAGDNFVISGSATKTVRITRISITGVATAANALRLILIKRSGTYTGGTSTTPVTIALHDSTNAAATASPRVYTVAPTATPASVGNVRAFRLNQSVAAGPAGSVEITFGNRPGQALTLRGVTEHLAINAPAAPGAGSLLTVDVEWTEE